MDTSDLRKRIIRALDDARKDSSRRRVAIDEASKAYEAFLDSSAVPMMRQAVTVLRAEGHLFSVHTPGGSVRLVSDGSPETFIELELDASGAHPQVIGRVSLARGRQGHLVDERALTAGRSVAELTEEDVSKFLVDSVPKLLVK
jgi:hypothetical protein